MATFTCSGCAFAVDIDYLPREYVLPDDLILPMPQRHVWCDTCGAISPAESLVEEAVEPRVRAELAALHRKELAANAFKEPWRRELLEEWLQGDAQHERALSVFGALRRGPPACLRCRSAEIDLPDDAWTNLRHGACGGVLVVTPPGYAAGGFIAPKPHQYSIEGELLRVGARVTSIIGDRNEEPLELWSTGRGRR